MTTEPDRAPIPPSSPPPELEALSCLRQRSDADLETFLTNVDQVSSLISQLASADSQAEMDRLRDDADEFIASFARAADQPVRVDGRRKRDGEGGAGVEKVEPSVNVNGGTRDGRGDSEEGTDSRCSSSASDDDAQLRGLLDAKIAAACPKGVLKALEEMEGREEARRIVLESMDRIEGRNQPERSDVLDSIADDWREKGNQVSFVLICTDITKIVGEEGPNC